MPSIRPKNTHAHSVSSRRRIACPRTIVPGSVGNGQVVELIADLLKDREPPDENERRCFDAIRRFHRWGRRDSVHGLRVVTVPLTDRDGKRQSGDGQPMTRRYVLELARLPSPQGAEWTLVMWGIDDVSAYFDRHPSERAARAAFRQAPQPVRCGHA